MTARKRAAGEPTAQDALEAREAVSRAIKRLGVLETIIIGAAVIIALGGGWLGALLARGMFDLPFRTMWMVLSIVFFVVPAAISLGMERRGRRKRRREAEAADREKPNNRPEG